MKRPILTVFPALVHGILMASGGLEELSKTVTVFILIVIPVFWIVKRDTKGFLLFAVLYAGFFCIGYMQMRPIDRLHNELEELEKDKSLYMEGEVIDIRTGDYGIEYTLRADYGNFTEQSGFQCILYTDKKAGQTVKTGNKIAVSGYKRDFNRASNYGGFDEQTYSYANNIVLKLKAEEITVTDGRTNELKEAARAVRASIEKALCRICQEREAGVFMAMLYGEKSDMDEELKNLYGTGGISHILAISGLHISLVGMGIYGLLRRRLTVWQSSAVSAFVMICYGLLAGGSVSAQRAILMFFIILLSRLMGRVYDMKNAVCIAGFLILFKNPCYIYNVGFQLSFAAVAAIAFVLPCVSEFLKENGKQTGGKIMKGLTSGITVHAVTGPILANTYYELPLYGFIVNLLVLPFMGIVVLSGFVGTAVSFLWTEAGGAILYIGVWILKFYEAVCSFVSKLPCAKIVTGHFDGLQLLLYYGLLIGLVCGIYELSRREYGLSGSVKRGTVFFCGILMQLFLYISFPERERFTFLDVGQGDCSVLVSGSGTVCLFDGGSSSKSSVGEYIILPFLKYSGIKHIDYILLSHSDADHINGILAVIEDKAVSVGCIVLPEWDEGFTELVAMAKKEGIEVVRADEKMSIRDGSMDIDVIHPAAEYADSYGDVNEGSLVAIVTMNNRKIAMTGDIGSKTEELLAEEGRLTDVDIVKVAHHGSKYSSAEEALSVLKPELSVISCGENNSYGHPHEETLQRLEAYCGHILVTYRTGCITVYLDNSDTLTYDYFKLKTP